MEENPHLTRFTLARERRLITRNVALNAHQEGKRLEIIAEADKAYLSAQNEYNEAKVAYIASKQAHLEGRD